MDKSSRIMLTDHSGVGEARRMAADLIRGLSFDDTQAGKVSIVVTELAGNIIKHAARGLLLFRQLSDEQAPGLEVLALDKGPGMADVNRCLEDGYSTAGSPGTGLGAIARLSNLFEIYSLPEKGTAAVAHVSASARPKPRSPIVAGAVCLPKDGQRDCGDSWAVQVDQERALILMADGLGHGTLAARAADEAVRVFRQNLRGHPVEIIEQAHGPLRATRGAGVSVAEWHYQGQLLRYAGVGNIAGVILDGAASRSLVTLGGTVGHELRQLREFSYPCPSSALLILHTDGLFSRWSLGQYPGLIACHPSLIAGVLYRDCTRGTDDVTVVVARRRT
ncbi:MAG: ATP-binding SpoIIE family protein phosphatase [Verrucomicrobiota bacterium]